MKELLYIALVIIVLIYCGNTSIQLHPFKIHMETWHRPLAAIMLFASIYVYDVYECRYNYRKGFKDGINHVIKNITEDGSGKDIQKQS